MKQSSFKFQKTSSWPSVLGLDISNNSLKYLLVSKKGKNLKIEGFGKYQLEGIGEELYTNIGQIISKLFQKGENLKQVKTVLGIDGPQVIVRKDSIPPLSKKEIGQTLTFGIQKELGKEGEVFDVVSDYICLGSDDEKSGNMRYLTFGATEDLVNIKVSPVATSGVVPEKVVPSVAAMMNLVQFLPFETRNQLIAFLDIGTNKSMLILIKSGLIEFYREIVIGGNDFTKAITGTIFHEGRAIQFSTVEANEFKFKYGYPLGFAEGMTFRGAPLSEVGTMMRPVVERLVGEIQRSISFYQDKSGSAEVQTLYLLGGGARLKHLPEVISEKLEVPVSLYPLPDNIRFSGRKEDLNTFKMKFSEQVVPFALALESSPTGNLLPLHYLKVRKTKKIQKILTLTAVGLVAILSLFSYNLQTRETALSQSLIEMKRKAVESKDRRDNELVYQTLEAKKIDLENRLSGLNQLSEQDEKLIQILRLISHVFPQKLKLVSLDYVNEPIDAGQKKSGRNSGEISKEESNWIVRLYGLSENPPNDVGVHVAQLIVDMIKSGYFVDVKMEKELVTPDTGDYHFIIVSTIQTEKG